MTERNPYDANFDDLALFARPVAPAQPPKARPVEKLSTARAKKANSKYDQRAALILQRLMKGPLGCFEAERLIVDGVAVHRAQAVIHAMREKGHLIDTIRLHGNLAYVYRGKVEKIKAGKHKELYYSTRHWKYTALQRKKMDAWQCRQCGSIERLETHHWRYNLFDECVRRDLITLCRDCHEAVHEAASGSGMHFPNTITRQQADRIEADQ